MKLITNPGANLSPRARARYDFDVAPAWMLVDGDKHDLLAEMPPETIDDWVAQSKTHPVGLGTTAAEFAELYSRLLTTETEFLTITSSRELVRSFDSARTAGQLIMKRHPTTRFEVMDSGFADVGTALACILAGEAVRAGLSLSEVLSLLTRYKQSAVLRILPQTLEWLVRGGRATPVRAFAARLLNILPMLGFENGELSVVGRVSRRVDPAEAISAAIAERIDEQKTVWVGITHGNNASGARALAVALRKRFNVMFEYIWQLCPAVYLHGGPGLIGALVLPLDELPWTPPTPPDL